MAQNTNFNFRSLKIVSHSLLLASLLNGCGSNSSDPLKNYPELKKGVAPYQQMKLEQTTLGAEIIVMAVQGENAGSETLVFEAGKSKQYQIATQVNLEKVKYNVKKVSAPGWLSVKDMDKNGVVTISGSPGYADKDASITLEIVPSRESLAASLAILDGLAEQRRKTFRLTVVQDNSAPVVTKKSINGVAISANASTSATVASIQSNQTQIPVEILVSAIGVTSAEQISIQAIKNPANTSGESNRFDISTAVVKNPKTLSAQKQGNLWKFSLILNGQAALNAATAAGINRGAKDKSTIESFEGDFGILIINLVNGKKTEDHFVVKVSVSDVAGIPRFDVTTYGKAEINKDNVIHIKISSSNGRGTVSLDVTENNRVLNGIKGLNAKISCESKENVHDCTIAMKPSCEVANSVKIPISAKVSLGKKENVGKELVVINMNKDSKVCPEAGKKEAGKKEGAKK